MDEDGSWLANGDGEDAVASAARGRGSGRWCSFERYEEKDDGVTMAKGEKERSMSLSFRRHLILAAVSTI